MVKQCNVVLNNDLVTVVRFGEKNVQLPAIGKDAKAIHVAYENGRYFVVDGNQIHHSDSDEIALKPKKRAMKKTTMKDDEETVNE